MEVKRTIMAEIPGGWDCHQYKGNRPINQVCNAWRDAPNELELKDLDDWRTDSEGGCYLPRRMASDEYRDASAPGDSDVFKTYAKMHVSRQRWAKERAAFQEIRIGVSGEISKFRHAPSATQQLPKAKMFLWKEAMRNSDRIKYKIGWRLRPKKIGAQTRREIGAF